MTTSANPNASTVYTPYQFSATAPFQFQPVFDGAIYTVSMRWNFADQRFYALCTDINGNTVYNLPVVPSPDDFGFNINGGYFQSSLVFRDSTQQWEVTPANPTVA